MIEYLDAFLAWAEREPIYAGLAVAVALSAATIVIRIGSAAGAVAYRVLADLVRGFRPLILWRRPEPTAARLADLRRAAMSSWESSLEWGEGNNLSGVYAPMVVGLLDVATAAEEVLPDLTGDRAKRLKDAIDRYVRDADYQRRQAQWDRAHR